MSQPHLSVVVPSVNTLADVRDCLTHLDRQRSDVELEVVVVERQGDETRRFVREEYPWVKLIEVEKSQTIPQMRAMAFDVAEGEAVAVIEDHVMVPDGWAKHMLAELEKTDGVVAGSVQNAATETLMDWACFLCEYHHLIPPIEEGEVPWLTGNNVTYKRSVLARFRDAFNAGKWENHLHDAFKSEGIRLVCRPEIEVGHKKHYTFGEYLSQRYLYSRSYAGATTKDASFVKRLIRGAASFILPPVMFLRVVSCIWKKGRHRGLLIKSLPLIACFTTAWGLGEVAGCWFGPGDSLSKVC
jgi:GT2 family glycosyltransferase